MPIFEQKAMRSLVSIIIFLIVPCFLATGQSRPEKIVRAKQHMEVLENGYLLIQLFNRDKTKYFIQRELGDEAVKKYEEKQLANHKKLMLAFKKHYSFSKVVFFYSNDKEHIKNRSFDSVSFYGYNHELLSQDSIRIDKFLIGEISRVESDSITYSNAAGESHKRPSYAFSAFIVRDDQFRQLEKPFPFYVRTFEGTPILRRKENGLVKSLQSKLERSKRKFK